MHELKQRTEIDLIKITDWFHHKSPTIYWGKQFLAFSSYTKKLPTYNSLNMNYQINIIGVEKVKYLGVDIDKHRWDVHITKVIRKLRMLIYQFKYVSSI